MNYSPLEQFEILLIYPLSFFNLFDISLTNSFLYIILAITTSIIVFNLSLYRATIIPNKWQLTIELFYGFLLDIVKQQIGYKGLKYFPIIFTTFFFILFSNLVGLVPGGFSPTGHIILTFTLGLGFNLGFLFIGLLNHGIKFFNLFVPQGAPKPLLPLIVVIEVISYCLKPFSLAIRLFANIMAGHTLLHILSTFALGFFKAKNWIIIAIFFVLLFLVSILEFGVAFLQAYVFVMLMSIYLNDSINLH